MPAADASGELARAARSHLTACASVQVAEIPPAISDIASTNSSASPRTASLAEPTWFGGRIRKLITTATTAPISVSTSRVTGWLALPSASRSRPVTGIWAAAPGVRRSVLPVRNPTVTIKPIDQACRPNRSARKVATMSPTSTPITRCAASAMDARRVTSATNDAVIGA